jgi:RIO kinase 1|tara:strand:- start:1475 stop:2179 length:705 start_codon:yes stop_codon:yes gene_type:complete
MAKVTKEKFKTMHNVFDDFTNRTLFKLISEGHFEGLESTIELGKEANIFSAVKGNKSVIVKIYRVNSCNFNKMFDYIKSDPRYATLQGKKRNIIFHWVQREYRNLMKARQAGVKVPTPITFKNHILVMEFIGGDEGAALMLKDDRPKDLEKFFNEIIKNMKRLYKAGLVHGDLSPFNILNFKEKPVLIDFSQCSSLRDSRAEEYLKRDVKNICDFFKKKGLQVSEEEVFEIVKA